MVALRSALHRSGLRFRKDYLLRLSAGRAVRVDIAFPRAKLAVFVDGCFWHRCPEHGTDPRANASYWGPKLDRNVQRDRETDALLEHDGWSVIRVWEHEDPDQAAALVIKQFEATAAGSRS